MAEDTSGDESGSEGASMDSEEVDEQMREVEENPPDKLEDWPDGPAKYRTIGGGDANEEWEEGPTRHLGPSDVRYHEDGSVTVKGEPVDNPEHFKAIRSPAARPIPMRRTIPPGSRIETKRTPGRGDSTTQRPQAGGGQQGLSARFAGGPAASGRPSRRRAVRAGGP